MRCFCFEEGMEHVFGLDPNIDDGIISVYLDTYFENHPDIIVKGEIAEHIVLYVERNGQYEMLYKPMKYVR